MTENQVDIVLEILNNRGIETYGEAIYGIAEDEESFTICIDDNQMKIKKKVVSKYD